MDNDLENFMQGIKLLDEQDIEKQSLFDSFLYLESLNSLENMYTEMIKENDDANGN